jgi:endonuclease III
VKNATQCAKKLTALLKKLPEPPTVEPVEPVEDDADPMRTLVMSFLMVDATTEKAETAYRRLDDHVVDYNDLRVTMPHELVGYMGTRYPRALERAQRLRTVLRNIYLREHSVTLARLADAGKREVKKYLESLEGIVPYVSSRVMLLSFDTHAIPVDEQLRQQLVAAGAADEAADVGEVSNWLSRQVKAGEGLSVHRKLQHWVDNMPARGRSKTAKESRGSTSKTTKKKKTTKRAKSAGGSRRASRSSAAS